MPKKVEPEATTSEKPIRLPTATNISSAIKQCINYKKRVGEVAGEMADVVNNFKKDKYGDPGALRVVVALFQLSDEKLAVRFAHLMHYIEFAKDASGKTLTQRANVQGKLFGDDADEQDDGEPAEETKDLRPRHLRQPGASGADIDKAERAAGADNVTPLKH